ncbi:MAG: peptidase, partial [Planctomycetota bacterium]
EMEKIEIEYHSFRPQRSRKFVSPSKFLEEYSLHPKGHSLSLVVRGKPFSMANWEEGVLRYGDLHGVRYRLTQWMSDGRHLISLSDKGGEEGIEIFDTHLEEEPKRLELNIGRPLNMKVSPVKDEILISNHRQELLLVDLKRKKTTLIDQSPYARFEGFDWSSDGRWIVYSKSGTPKTFSLYLYHLESKKIYPLTSPRFRDVQPYFDVEGKYIYFLSYREFNPVYDSHYFDLGFPKGGKPYLIVLRNNLPNPFEPLPKSPDEKVEEGKDSKKPGPTKVEIDLEGIEKRILPFPVPERRYQQIEGAKGKVLFSYEPVEGSFEKSWMAKNGEGNQILEYFDFDLQKTEILARGINDFKVAMDSNVVVYRSGSRLRVLPIRPEDSGKTKDPTPSRESGWIDLERVKVEVDPLMEWKQMFREIWRLQRDHFWSPDMCGLDWDKVYHRYEPLLERLATRSEFSDLIWEMQGELGTSHAYELGGDYRQPPAYYQGFLGADFKYNEEKGGYEILHIIEGDPWSLTFSSPLIHPGAGVSKGDVLLAIDGQYLDKETPPEKLLVHKRKERVQLLIETKEGRKRISVSTLDSEFPCRYREWVEKNRSYVLEATKGRVGYLHIPDMGPFGFAEFHRYFLHEVEKDGLIVDVRYNGGGHVSQLILEKLARKRIGYDISRWGQPDPYPSDSLLGPIVAITNEDAGSDGDIFSHCFKLYKLGTLVGKRTWGGVIGIWPRHFLVDGSITTQPEFSFWFVDVGFGVENYGTDPDVEVENTPMDWRDGKDRQLDKAIEIILSQLEANPPKLPEFSPKPRLEVP